MAQNFVKALPGGNGWSAGGYNFVVDDDGSFKYGKPDDSLSSVSASDFSQIVSTSKPTQRTDGNALVIGDRWYKNDDGTSWYWNGTYWLSPPENLQLPTPAGTPQTAIGSPLGGATGIFIYTYQIAQQSGLATANDASNYRNINLFFRQKASNTETLIGTIQNYPLPIAEANSWTITINTNYLIASYSGVLIRGGTLVGTDGAYQNYTPIITFSWSQ